MGHRDGAVVRALASHRCGPGLIPGPGVTCELSLLLVLVLAPRVFLRVLRFSSLHKNQQKSNSNSAFMHVCLQNKLLISLISNPRVNKVLMWFMMMMIWYYANKQISNYH